MEFKGVLTNIDRYLDEFIELAQLLIEKLPTRQSESGSIFLPDELERLLRESVAAATLFQCFCSACPVNEHRGHTAYPSLAPNSSGSSETRMAILSRVKKEKSLVWLRVVSGSSNEITAPEPQHKLESNGLERRRSSDAIMPPSKTCKTDAGPFSTHQDDMVMNQTRHPIQVCPEHFTQYEEFEVLAMQMVDASNAFHKIYLLPADKRPPEKCKPVSLAKMLLERHKPQMAVGDTETLWKVQVARLIAEAVLRFDCPQTRCQWDKEGVMFYTLQTSNFAPEPFLKVEIESYASGTAGMSDYDQLASGGGNGRSRMLLNLAFILLQLGLFAPIEAPPNFFSNEQYRNYIIQEIRGKEAQILGDYLTVVRHCVGFSSLGEEDAINREGFREKYYRTIILPLKKMEANLLSVRSLRKKSN